MNDDTLSQQKFLKSPSVITVLGLGNEGQVLGLGFWKLPF